MAVDNMLERFVFSTIHKDFRIITMSQGCKQLILNSGEFSGYENKRVVQKEKQSEI